MEMKQAMIQHHPAININLMQSRRERANYPLAQMLLFAAAALLAAGVGWLWYDAQHRLDTAESRLGAVAAQLAALESGGPAAMAAGVSLDERQQRLRADRPVMSEVLAELTAAVPLYANVAKLEMNDEGLFSLTFQFATSEELIGFRHAVAAAPHFRIVSMGAINNALAGGEEQRDAPPEAGGVTLPVYQTRFELQYSADGQGGDGA